jgi:hypothetical protein
MIELDLLDEEDYTSVSIDKLMEWLVDIKNKHGNINIVSPEYELFTSITIIKVENEKLCVMSFS